MRVKKDRDEFDKRQKALIQEVAFSVKERLQEMGLGGDRDLVEGLVFDVSAILDGSREMELDGRPLLPFLTFADDRDPEELLAVESGSWMHEICGRVVEEMFEDESST
jgi:hypothetical protein